MNFINPPLAGKNHIVQLVCLILLVGIGVCVGSSLGTLLNTIIFHTTNYNEAANTAAFLRVSQVCNSLGVALVPALLFAWCQEGKFFGYNAADRKPYYLLVNVVLVLSIVLLPLVAVLMQWNQSLHLPESMAKLETAFRTMEANAQSMTRVMTFNSSYGTLALNVIVMALLPAVCEEFLFRGTLQSFLHKWSGKPHLAIWITAVLFSAIHLQFFGFIPRMLLGAYLGYLYYWSRSLWLPVLAHFLHNALSLFIEFTFLTRGIIIDEVDLTRVHGAIPMLIGCVLVTAMSLVFMWRIQKDTLKDQ